MQLSRHDRELRRYFWRVIEVCLMLVFIVGFALLLSYVMKYILPFVIGWVCAILLIPIVRFMERRGLSRFTAVIIVTVCAVALVVAVSGGLIIGTAREATSFISSSQAFFQNENHWLKLHLSQGQVFYGKLPPQVAQQIQGAIQQIVDSVEVWLKHFVTSLLGSFTQLPEMLFVGVIAVVTAFFIMLRRERMMTSFFKLVPPGWETKLRTVIDDMSRAFLGTIRVQFILMCLSAVLGVIGMYIVGIPYAILLGILFALTGLIPILGSALLTVPWAVGALAIGDVSMAMKVIGLQVVISLIRHAVEPKILADSVGLDTLTTLFALYIGLRTIGVVGLFIGPIILIGAKGLLRTHLFVDFLPNVEEVDKPFDGDVGT